MPCKGLAGGTKDLISANGLHPAAAAEAVAHPEDVGEVHPAVVEGLEDPQEFEVAANAFGAVREMAGRQPPTLRVAPVGSWRDAGR